jgi:hypothetical protein
MIAAAPIAWYGGKARLAGRIAGLLPYHDTYVEAFGGAAAVLFSKKPANLEVYNDIDSGLVTFFRALRDRPEALQHALRFTPYARQEFTVCRDTWKSTGEDVERARRWYVRAGATNGTDRSEATVAPAPSLRQSMNCTGSRSGFALSRSSTTTGRKCFTGTTRRALAFIWTRRITPLLADG